MNPYQQYCKPTLSAALGSVGLAKSFHRAEAQYLYYKDEQGEERQVLDLLGGYGAVILGHNHPKMLKTLTDQIEQGVAFHNQFSLRSGAAELAQTLNPLIQQETGWKEDFLFAYASTGAESVEVALKHAEVKRGQQLDALQEQYQQTVENLNISAETTWEIPPEVLVDHPELADSNQRLEALKCWNNAKFNQAPVFIALKHAFHGKLNASIQLTYGDMYRHPFRRLGLNTRFYSPDELTTASLAELKSQERAYLLEVKVRRGVIHIRKADYPFVAALMVEPVQGEGGVYALSGSDVTALHSARDTLQCPMISDEVQSGCGRCGTFLAGSAIGLKPDYVVLSKGLGGGVSKIGVVAIRESAYAQGFDMVQSSTFGEDDWSARVAKTFVEYLTANDGETLKHIEERGNALFTALCDLQQEYPDILSEIRGKGLLQGVVFKDQSHAQSLMIKTTAYQGAIGYLVTGHLLVKHGIRVAPPASSGDVVRVEPSVQLSDENIKDLVDALESVCLALRYQDTGFLLSYLLDSPTANKHPEPRDFRPWYDYLNIINSEGEADYKVAFVNHLISSEWLKEVDESLAHFTDTDTEKLLSQLSFDRRVAPFAPVRIRSSQGNTVDFTLYPINATSQQIGEMLQSNDLEPMRSAVDERLAAARDDGCKIAGLGMFTSIVTNNGKASETSGIKLTTGNALTVAMAAEAIQSNIAKRGKNIEKAAIVGAAGNIGSVYCTLVAEYCGALILVGSGRPGSAKRVIKTAELVYETALQELAEAPNDMYGLGQALLPFATANDWLSPDFLAQDKLGKVIYEWFDQHPSAQAPITVTETLSDIQDADLLVCAANSSEAFIEADHLKQDVLVCDIAVPHNLPDELLKLRPDIECLRGGIVNTPNGESLDPRARAYLKTGEVYACMAETIVLGLEQYGDHYSYGNIDKHQVKRIKQFSNLHGLSLAGNKETESM